MLAASEDRILFWPIILALAGPAAFVLAWSGPLILRMFFVPYIIVILWMSAGLFGIIAAIAWIHDRAWRRLLSTLILPLSVVVAGLNQTLVWSAGRTAGDYVHLLVMYPHYMATISALPVDQRQFVVFEWGGFIVGSGIAYDASDETSSTHPSQQWKERAEQHGVIGSGYPRAFGHFYFVNVH